MLTNPSVSSRRRKRYSSLLSMSLRSFIQLRFRRIPSGENRAEERFSSPEPIPRRSRRSMAKWMLTRRPRPYPAVAENAHVPSPDVPVERGQWEAVMVNHATILIRLHGLNVLTDPVWSDRVSPVSWMGPKRKRPAGIRWEELPPVDAVLVSHDHYDHLDIPTLKRLEERFHPVFLAPLGLRSLLVRHCGAQARICELDWWQSAALPSGGGTATVTFTPSRHYSGRSPFHGGANRSLWGGFFLRAADGPGIYFAGDTGWTRFFAEIRDRLGPPDLALLSIGSYLPEDLMAGVHLSPRDAVRAFRTLRARQGMAFHFGTWQLADDGYQETLNDFREALFREGVQETSFIAADNGFTLQSTGKTGPQPPPSDPGTPSGCREEAPPA